MKALGIVRKIDDLGRIVVHMEVRRHFKWDAGTPLEMLATNKGLLLRPYLYTNEEKEAVINSLEDALELTDNPAVVEVLNGALDFINKQ